MKNNKGFQLSVSMLVVVILGLALLGIGFSIFFNAYNQTVDIKERVDSQTAQQLNNLLDTGEAVVVPLNSKEVDRGDFVDFDLGISNELRTARAFYIYIGFDSYSGRTNSQLITDALQPRTLSGPSCADSGTATQRTCADKWILIPTKWRGFGGQETDKFILTPNERYTVPIRFDLPRRVDTGEDDFGLPAGQYIFNVDVFNRVDDDVDQDCDTSTNDPNCVRYFSRKKLYVRVN